MITEEKENGVASSSLRENVSENNPETELKKSGEETKVEDKSHKIEGEEGEEEEAMKIENESSQNQIEPSSSTSTVSPGEVKTRAILASGSMDQTVKLWDPVKGTCLHSLSGYSSGMVYSIAYDNKAEYIAVGHADGILCVWTLKEGTLFRKYQIPKGPAIFDVSWSSDDHRIGITSAQGKVFFIDFKSQ